MFGKALNCFNGYVCLIFVIALAASVGSVAAQQVPANRLLLPYFEVSLDGSGNNTVFSVVNPLGNSIDLPARITLYSNWGVEVLNSSVVLDSQGVLRVDLQDWIVRGELPERALSAPEIEHIQTALSGRRSPLDSLFYSSRLGQELATGFAIIQLEHPLSSGVLFGDYFIVSPGEDQAQGEVLVGIDRQENEKCSELCLIHGLRFLAGQELSTDTEIVIWSDQVDQQPSSSPDRESRLTGAEAALFDSEGRFIGIQVLGLLPLQVLTAGELGVSEGTGWIDLLTDEDTYITVRYSSQDRFSAALQAFCLPSEFEILPKIVIEKFTNGADADAAPGPRIGVGSPVTWTYRVTNLGD